jgi:hypothetical protein
VWEVEYTDGLINGGALTEEQQKALDDRVMLLASMDPPSNGRW